MIEQLLSQLEFPFTGEELFDHLNDVVFFIKNARGEYLVVNQTLAERCNVASKSDLIGRTSAQVLRAPLGASYLAQDMEVLQTGLPLLSQLELHVYASQEVGWCLTTKLPLRNKAGQVIGLVGVSQDLRLPDIDTEEYRHVAEALDFAKARLANPPSVEELAAKADMTRYQLDRRMQRVFGLTTGQWLLQMRIDNAQRMLLETDQAVAAVAMNVGYSCQSAFTRQFRKTTGMSPRDYRDSHKR